MPMILPRAVPPAQAFAAGAGPMMVPQLPPQAAPAARPQMPPAPMMSGFQRAQRPMMPQRPPMPAQAQVPPQAVAPQPMAPAALPQQAMAAPAGDILQQLIGRLILGG